MAYGTHVHCAAMFKLPLIIAGLLLFFMLLPSPAGATGHPSLLFDDVTQTYGYQHISEYPWSEWAGGIKAAADEGLTKNYRLPLGNNNADPSTYMSQAGYYAMSMAFEYQLTGEAAYAAKAKEALLYCDIGYVPLSPPAMTSSEWKAMAYEYYLFAYDWIQPTLTASEDAAIRDKLARGMDSIYSDLTFSGTQATVTGYVHDFYLPAYCTLGIGSVALADYTNPNHIYLKSMPSDWNRVGTSDLFVKDTLHYWPAPFTYDMPMISMAVDPSGKDLKGSYRVYYMDDLALWAQVYTKYYGRNIIGDYPIVRNTFMADTWSSLPNRYGNDYVTDGNTVGSVYLLGVANLLNSADRSAAPNHAWLAQYNSDHGLLPYSMQLPHQYYVYPGDIGPELPPMLYFVEYGDYSGIALADPASTSHLDRRSVYQVFRENWNNDSAWLSCITYNKEVRIGRIESHDDQLSFEYYNKGDLLLSDAGEVRSVYPGYYFGNTEADHNDIAVEDPRSPFAPSVWAGSPARGIYKGNSYDGLNDPPSVDTIINTGWMEAVRAGLTWDMVPANQLDGGYPDVGSKLSSPIAYDRTVLFPSKDYFIVVDRARGSQQWDYRTIFRPSSLTIKQPTLAVGSPGYGNVGLKINGAAYDWKSLAPKTEKNTSILTYSLEWQTTNPYGKTVNARLYTVPAGTVVVNKMVSRVGGYGLANEVYEPYVAFKAPRSANLNRLTVLTANYDGEAPYGTSRVPVYGTGNAVKVTGTDFVDYAYTGDRTSTFGPFTTDAEVAYARTKDQPVEYTVMDGTFLNSGGTYLLKASGKANYMSYSYDGSTYRLKVNGSSVLSVTLGQLDARYSSYTVLMDGAPYTGWSVADTPAIKLTAPTGEHTFVLKPGRTSMVPVLIWNGLVLLYDMNGTGSRLTDLSGKGNTGTVYGAKYVKLPSGASYLAFNGSGCYISCGDTPTLDPLYGITVEALFKTAKLGTAQVLVGKSWTHDPDSGYTLMLDKYGRPVFITFDRYGKEYILTGSSALAVNQWYQATATYDGCVMKLYVNGAFYGAMPCNGLSQSRLGLAIGRYSPQPSLYLNGSVASVKIYDRSLTAREVVNDYNLDRWRVGLPAIPMAG